MQDKLRGRRFDEPRRHGKWLIVPVGKGSMLLHFGMTGSLHWTDSGQARHRHDRVIFSFANGELRYRDMRKLQGLRWAEDQQEVEEILAQVGPDAAEISGDRLPELLTGRRVQIKSALMDQSIIAGIGNLLADEILWRAGIHPRRLCIHLDQDDFTRLDKARQTVLRQSIKVGRVPRSKSWLTGRREDPSARAHVVARHWRMTGSAAGQQRAARSASLTNKSEWIPQRIGWFAEPCGQARASSAKHSPRPIHSMPVAALPQGREDAPAGFEPATNG